MFKCNLPEKTQLPTPPSSLEPPVRCGDTIVLETPVKTVFHREIINIQRGHRINLQNRKVTRGDDAPTKQAIENRSSRSQLSIANKAFMGVVRRTPVMLITADFLTPSSQSDIVQLFQSSPPEGHTV